MGDKPLTQQKGLSSKALIELAEKHQLPVDHLLPTLESELGQSVDTSEILRVPYRIGTTMYRSMAHASRFFRELRDNGLFIGGKCPQCGHTIFPPQHPICHVCIKKGSYVEYEPIEFGTELEGTVLSWCRLVRGTSKHIGKGEVYPCVVKVDGSDVAVWQYVLPKEGVEIRVGARVRSILLPREQRTGEVTDFAFILQD